MASFAQQAPVTFNPYLPTVDTDLYGKVGMYKQNLYDKGVQQIQGAFDAIAGMKMARPQDKAYLQQHLDNALTQANEMGNLDYSLQNIVQNQAEKAYAIGNDEKVQNAIAATLQLQKGYDMIKKAKEEGKGYSAQNEDWYNKQVAEWYDDPEVGKSFKGTYTPFVDINKDLVEFFKDKHPNTILRQLPNGGYTLIEENGESIDPETIKAETKMFLQDPKYATQSMINGWSQYRGADLNKMVDNSISMTQNAINTQREKFLKDKDSSNPVEAAKAIQGLQDLKTIEGQLATKRSQLSQMALSNPESFRTQMYQDDIADLMGSRYGYSKISRKIVENPEFQAQQKQLENYLAWEQYATNTAFKQKEAELNQKKYELDVANSQWEHDHPGSKKGDGSGSGSGIAAGAVETPVIGNPLAVSNAEIYANDQIAGLNASLDAGMMDIMSGRSETSDLFERFNTGSSIVPVFRGATAQEKKQNEMAVRRAFATMLNEYEGGKSFGQLDSKLEQYSENQKAVQKMMGVMNDVNNRWKVQEQELLRTNPEFKPIADYENVRINPIDYSASDGKSYNITKADIVDRLYKIRNSAGGRGVNPIYTINNNVQNNKGTGKDRAIDEYVYNLLHGKIIDPEAIKSVMALNKVTEALPTQPIEVGITDLFTGGAKKKLNNSKYAPSVALGGDNGLTKKRNDFFSTNLLPYQEQFGGKGITIPHENAPQLRQNLLANLAPISNVTAGGHADNNKQLENALTILGEKDFDKVSITYLQPEGGNPMLQFNNIDDKGNLQTATVALTPEIAKGMNLYREDAAASLRKDLALDPNKYISDGRITRASTGDDSDFLSAKRIGNVKDAQTGQDKYFLKYHVKQDNGIYYLTILAKDIAKSNQEGKAVFFPVQLPSPYPSLEGLQRAVSDLGRNPHAAAMIDAALGGNNVLPTQTDPTFVGERAKAAIGGNPFADPNNPYIQQMFR